MPHHTAVSKSDDQTPGVALQSAPTLQKGQHTKRLIVDAALRLAGQIGLDGLSIGAVAQAAQMSKSGVFAHFGSRQQLQLSVLHEYHQRFFDEVFSPAMAQARGLARLRALFDNWIRRVGVEFQSGCIFISGAVAFDTREGAVRQALVESSQSWLKALQRAVEQARDVGHLQPQTEPAQLVFELHGLILSLYYEVRFLRSPGAIERAQAGFEGILLRYGATK